MEFVERVTESGIAPLDTFKKLKLVADGCWESPNGALRLYTKGFKNAVETHQEEMISFLM